jgi:hypothetical protein
MLRTEQIFVDATGARSVSEAVERRALEALRSVPGLRQATQSSERVDVEALAAIMGISVVDEAGLPTLAQLRPVGAGLQISVRPGLSRSGRRFVIAHELGHSLFYSRSASRPEHLVGLYNASELRAEERICSAFARALLLPREMFRTFFHGLEDKTVGSILVSVANIMRSTGVGIDTVMRRCADLATCTAFALTQWKPLGRDVTTVRLVNVCSDKTVLWLWRGRRASSVGLNSCDMLLHRWLREGDAEPGRYVVDRRLSLRRLGEATPLEARERCEISVDVSGSWRTLRVDAEVASALFVRPGGGFEGTQILAVLRTCEFQGRS